MSIYNTEILGDPAPAPAHAPDPAPAFVRDKSDRICHFTSTSMDCSTTFYS